MTPEQAAALILALLAAIVFLMLVGLAEWLARRYPPFGSWVERLIERISR
jgi:hypothetical protein